MSRNVMSPLPVFTFESLIAMGQWSAAQSNNRRKIVPKRETQTGTALSQVRKEKPVKTEA